MMPAEVSGDTTPHLQDIIAISQQVARERRIPRSTYRLQFSGTFTFQDARLLVPYFEELGVGDCYASPILKSCSPSGPGYDICDPSNLDPHLGTTDDFEAYSRDLQASGMGLLVDMVPNHMGINDPSNAWWMDVLENGPSSQYASYFDIEWHPAKAELQNKVLLPVLGDQYGCVLEKGELRLEYESGAFFVRYYQLRFPIAPCTYGAILGYRLGMLERTLGEDNESVRELKSILTASSYLPARTEANPERLAERSREKEIIKGRIDFLYRTNEDVRQAIDSAVRAFNGTVGQPSSFDLLDGLINSQAYRLAYWRVAAEEINYRRFFDVNELAAIRMEVPEVFTAVHQLVMRLLGEGRITGLRVDHPDGLWDPEKYFWQLQERYLAERVRARLGPSDVSLLEADSISVWLREQSLRQDEHQFPLPLYVVAEKILSEGESLPSDWPVEGTTGYDFLNDVNGLFIDTRNERAIDRVYSHFIGGRLDYRNLRNTSKKMIMLVSLSSEIHALSHELDRITEKDRHYRDFTLDTLTFALREAVAALPVYRTYISEAGVVSPHDRNSIEAAVSEAKRRNPRTATAVFDFLRDTLLMQNLKDFPEEEQESIVALVRRLQQVTSSVMAKGVEDTAFYVYNRLVSLNEVGGSPDRCGVSVAKFHEKNAVRRQLWRHSLLATSTHDTKRSEDVRARINVLSEIPEEWSAALERWKRLNLPKKIRSRGEEAPDSNDEYLLYQTLLGTWPDEQLTDRGFEDYLSRIANYMAKATKEAKVHTSWVNPNEEYDTAMQEFVKRVLNGNPEDAFIKDLIAFGSKVAHFGRFNSLSQVLLKLTSPGVPDIYQGTELWDYSLVDPDNRRPVDFPLRQSLLGEIKNRVEKNQGLLDLVGELVANSKDGRIKLYTIWRTLGLRRRNPHLFAEGEYVPLQCHGRKRVHVCAFARSLGGQVAVVVAPRLLVGLCGGELVAPVGPDIWADTWIGIPRRLKVTSLRNHFTGEILSPVRQGDRQSLPLSKALGAFPVAILEKLGN